MPFNLTKKPNPLKPNPLAGGASTTSQKRKKGVFDADSDDEDDRGGRGAANETQISTLGGIDEAPSGVSGMNADPDTPRPTKRKIVPLGQGAKPKIKPLSKASIFADDDEEDEAGPGPSNGDKDGQTESLGIGKGGTKYGLNSAPSGREYTNLSAMHSSKKHASEAHDLDPSIYSYDAVYESLHAKPVKKKAADGEGEEGGDGVPRYMQSLLRSAEIRKRDQMRARDRLLAKEREAEGDEFADKEKFVTSAYKAQQAELRRVEEEEKAQEEAEEERRRKNGGSGMVGFYRDLLSRGEEQHEAAMKAADEAAKKVEGADGDGSTSTAEEEKTETQMAAELNARGAHIAVNDDGQVVDKRQLLSAGLNVAPKPKTAAPAAARTGAGPSTSKPRPVQGGGRAGQRARQTEMIAAQLEEQERQREEAEAAKQKEIAERNRSQKSTTEVSGARERYLARKREREAAAKGS
ncbi:coiled-coil domain-containing protein 55-domain containing protein [Aspergillus pseudoustus]|uniref:Coiled-coil domain-containing protein 55-domain containing protein n=1 Tax=Aspergillus pseudoustus TaxID=1810923 RepID=A0ABR4JEJ2_9EURO